MFWLIGGLLWLILAAVLVLGLCRAGAREPPGPHDT